MKAEKLLLEAELLCRFQGEKALGLLNTSWIRSLALLTDERVIFKFNNYCCSFNHDNIDDVRMFRSANGAGARILMVTYSYGLQRFKVALMGPRSVLLMMKRHMDTYGNRRNLSSKELKLSTLLKLGFSDVEALSFLLDLDEEEIRKKLSIIDRQLSRAGSSRYVDRRSSYTVARGD